MNDFRTLCYGYRKLAASGLVVFVLALALSCGGKADSPAPQERSEDASPKEEPKIAAGSVVTLDDESIRLISLEVSPVAAPGASGLVANGTIAYDANRVSLVAPRAEGRLTVVRTDLGQAVQAGSVLAILESPDVGEARGRVESARANLELAQQGYEREKNLFEQHVSSEKEMLEARAAYLSSRADFDAAEARARALGASAGPESVSGGSYPLLSPIAGTVVERNATPGQIAGPETHLFTVADLRSLWIEVDVYEADADRVRAGSAAAVVTRAIPGESFPGHVTYAGGVVDSATRTVKVRVEVDNQQGRLRPGMYAEVRIEEQSATRAAPPAGDSSVVVSELAVQDLDGQAVVFVPEGVAGRFVARAVTVGPRLPGGLVTILGGLTVGEQVVTRGAFQLKSELLKESFGDDD